MATHISCENTVKQKSNYFVRQLFQIDDGNIIQLASLQ